MNLQILNPLRWRKSVLICLLVAFLVVWFGFLDTYSVWTRYQLSHKKTELIQETANIKEKTKLLDQKIDDLKNNPELVEKIAREEYGMREKGDTVYRVESH